MQTIELHAVLPEVFSGRNGIVSDIWHREVSFKKGNTYLIEAASGTGKSSLCSFLYGYRSDYQGMICFDGENIKKASQHPIPRVEAVSGTDGFRECQAKERTHRLLQDEGNKSVVRTVGHSR